MKKVFSLIICLAMIFALASCTKEKPNNGGQNDPVNNGGENNDVKIEVSSVEKDGAKYYTFSKLPTSVKELESLDITDEYQSVCAVIFALAMYEKDADTSVEMLDFVMGPESPSPFDKDFLKNQFEQYPYVIRSYFEGSSPENDYKVDEEAPVTIKVSENVYSRSEDGYVNLLLKSSGADSERGIKLRKKNSTGEWFLFSDTYKGVCAGIRIPAGQDAWN